ncbi:MAG: carbohydrate ABC transporter permease [Candidatus Bipolaricaulia bacterium]
MAKVAEVKDVSVSRDRSISVWDRERLLGWMFIAPAVIYIVALVGFPFVMAFIYSFSDVTTGDPSIDFVGLRNFKAILNDVTFRRSLKNTFVFTFISQAIVLVLAKTLALVLEKDFRGKWIARFLILLPWTAPISLGVLAWLWMLDSVFSPIDWIFRYLGLIGRPAEGVLSVWNFDGFPNLYWLGKPGLAMASVIGVHVWRMLPLATMILLAGLTSIPKDILDAAEVDGARFWRRLFHVIIPMMLPIMSVAVLFGVIFTFTDMTIIRVLTQGNPPPHMTQVLASWAYFKGIDGGDLAQGAAIALFLFPVMAGVAVFILRFARRTEVT